MKKYNSFKEFYPFYLSQHQNSTCRSLHYLGSMLVLVCVVLSMVKLNGYYMLLAPLIGYGCAWIGHFVFEKNKPATFTYPLYSFIGDWVMLVSWLLRKSR